MYETYSNTIGIFGNKQQVHYKIKQIAETLPKEEIIRTILSAQPNNCRIEMKNGDRYVGVSPTQNARGHRWTQVYVPYDVDLEILQTVIYPAIRSNLPKHEQVIGYWF